MPRDAQGTMNEPGGSLLLCAVAWKSGAQRSNMYKADVRSLECSMC